MSAPSSSFRGSSDREIELAASRWIGRRDAGMTPDERAAFEAWRRADPRHERALARHEATWRFFDRPAGAGQAAELMTALAQSRTQRRRRRHAGLAASLVIAIALGAVWQRSRVPEMAPAFTEARAGGAVVILTEKTTLPDGSTVEAKPGAEFRVAFSDEVRRVELSRGEALFSVLRDSRRPFVVTAGGVAVRAVGTAFSVQVERDEIGVLVTSGRVAVETPPNPEASSVALPAPAADAGVAADTGAAASMPAVPEAPLELKAGQRTVVVPSARATPRVENLSSAELASRLAWRSPRLEFTATPLQEAIELFNRHAADSGAKRLVIEPADPALAQLEVSGYFRANNVAAFLHLISQTLGVTSDEQSDRIVVRRSP